jgi:class 3 adenylate cyclase
MASAKRTGHPCAILFADMFGSAELYETLGNARAQAIIAETLRLLSEATVRHCGEVIKMLGDGAMCIFSSARDAMDAATEMQESITHVPARVDFAGRSPALRVGFHYGPVITQGADVFGDAVNVAARVLAHAKPGEILLTKETARKIPADASVNIRSVGRRSIKGKAQLVELCEVVSHPEGVTQPRGVLGSASDACLVIGLGNKVVEVSSRRPVVRLGRSPESDLVVANPLASRAHARIEYRGDHFILVDESLNGTYLLMKGMAEIELRRDQIALLPSGLISLGKSIAVAEDMCLEFKVRTRRSDVRQRVPPAPRRSRPQP